MKSRRARIVVSCGAVLLLALVAGSGVAKDRMRVFDGARPGSGQEVLGGSYFCSGSVYTDEQQPNISVGSWLGATSGITEGFSPPYHSAFVDTDLSDMAARCATHVQEVYDAMPGICALGELRSQGGDFGNGSSVSTEFQFSCQGSRDRVVSVIGAIGRMAVGARFD